MSETLVELVASAFVGLALLTRGPRAVVGVPGARSHVIGADRAAEPVHAAGGRVLD